ncbi:DUF402 domain-containing protein [Candidatus Bipolaricaulota bacterium]|nr:DUF402 domain-containing protein [Candidatus Bipolaricaulota bacterium]
MPGVKVRLRGIYATALTILLSQRCEIVDPSEVIQRRLSLPPSPGPAEVQIFDRADRHGVVIEGVRSGVEEVVQILREKIPWALFLPQKLQRKTSSPLAAAAALLSRYEAEFPRPAKELLDEVRAKAVPTLPGHHLLKTVDPARVDEAEGKNEPANLPELAQGLWEELVGPHYAPGKTVTVWHLKAGEPPIRQSGEVVERTKETLVLRRNFGPGGLYDGLGLPKEPGDYGLFELPLGQWWGRRLYFRSDGTFLGEIYNVHTTPELLPEGVRYLDLEVDIVRTSEGIRVIDEEILDKKVAEGLISEALAKKAKEVVAELLRKLQNV